MIYRYPGGKSKRLVQNKILARFPGIHQLMPEYKEYREPFVGGGGIYFRISPFIRRWINDKDKNLIAVYKALKERPAEFIASCRQISPPIDGEPLKATRAGGKPIQPARMVDLFDQFAWTNDPTIDPALRFYYLHRTTWNGRVNYEMPNRLYFSSPTGWNIVNTGRLEKAAFLLRDTKITNLDYRELFEADGDDVLIYADPPYVCNTFMGKTSQLYRHNFTEQDHFNLADTVRRCKHKVVLSYDDDEQGTIRRLYAGFNMFNEKWAYSGTSSAKDDGQSSVKRIGKELIITNF